MLFLLNIELNIILFQCQELRKALIKNEKWDSIEDGTD